MKNKSLDTVIYKNRSTQKDLINLLREQCNLRIQIKLGQFKKLHFLKRIRRKIAVIKYCLSHKASSCKK